MWVLFTRALTAATSTTRVAILNTSANFMVTALLGMFIFSEGLPFGWWVGASFLVAGSVVIGAREGKDQKSESSDQNVGLDEAVAAGDATAAGIGAGGVGQSILAEERYIDEGEDADDVLEGYQDHETDEDDNHQHS